MALLTEQMIPAILSVIGIVLLLSLYSYYVIPASILVYANNRKLAAAFSVSEITSLLFDRAYLIGFLYVVLAVFLTSIVEMIVVLVIPSDYVVWSLLIIVGVIGSLTVWSIWGGVYRDIYPPIES